MNRKIDGCDDDWTGVPACVTGRGGGGGGGGGHRGDVRNNTTRKINCTSPETRLGDQNWSQLEADSPDLAADLPVAARAVAAF